MAAMPNPYLRAVLREQDAARPKKAPASKDAKEKAAESAAKSDNTSAPKE